MTTRTTLTLLRFATAVLSTSFLPAQVGRLSPHETASETLADQVIHITYGRPYLRGREFIGTIVKHGEMWRTGADEATVLWNQGSITIGPLEVPPGRYSLFTIPGKEKWTLVISRQPDLMGKTGYNRKKDLGRVDMSIKVSPERTEQFTIGIRKSSETAGMLEMKWGTVLLEVPISARQQ